MNRTRTILLAAAALTMFGACGSDAKASPAIGSGARTPTTTSTATASTGAPAANSGGIGQSAVQLGGNPCALLTVPEI